MRRNCITSPHACTPVDDELRCIVCGIPDAPLVRVWDEHQHRVCPDAAACRERAELWLNIPTFHRRTVPVR